MMHFRYDEDSDRVVLTLKEEDLRIEHEIRPENLPSVEEKVQHVMRKSNLISAEEYHERKEARES